MCHNCGVHNCRGCQGVWPFNRPFYNPPYTTPFNQQCRPPVPDPLYACPTCKPCNPCAPVGCLHKIMSDCVIMSKQYTCLGIGATDTLTVAFDKVEALCGTASSNGVVQFGFGGGDFQLDLISYPTWTTGPSDYTTAGQYSVSQSSYYKVTVEITVLFDTPTSAFTIGVGVNGLDPVLPTIDPWRSAKITNPTASLSYQFVTTVTFYLSANVGDLLNVKYLGTDDLCELAPVKVMFERIPLIT